ncbi:hypothetical protein D3C75_318960 [compost metagenome]
MVSDNYLNSLKEEIKKYLNLKYVGNHKEIGNDIYFDVLEVGVKGAERKLKYKTATGTLFENVDGQWQQLRGILIKISD